MSLELSRARGKTLSISLTYPLIGQLNTITCVLSPPSFFLVVGMGSERLVELWEISWGSGCEL